jgi:hypothetical protein
MQFTKSLIAAAMLVATGAAQAYTNTDEILTVVDTTNNSSYSLDLGETASALLASPSLNVTINASSDTSFSSFISGVGSSDTVIYRVEGEFLTTGTKPYANVISTFTTSTSTDLSSVFGVSALASLYTTLGTELATYGQSLATVTGASAVLAAGSGFFPTYGTAAQSNEGNLDNSAALGSALNLWQVNKTSSTNVNNTDLAAVNFSVTGTGSSAVGTLAIGSSVSSVPLPTSVWLFLSGVMGVLSLKRRKAA